MDSLIKPEYLDCIEACQRCLVDCQACLTHMAGRQSSNDCPRCCVECIDACLTTVKSLAADSRFATRYVAICADICLWCAEQCEAHEGDHCRRCAESCRHCVAMCQKLVA